MHDHSKVGSAISRRSRRRSEIHERIFRAALQLFAQRGLASTTIEQITELADVGKGTFFNYFRSKEDVFLSLGEIQLGNVEAALEDARAGKEDISAVLRHLARALTREPGRSPELLRSLLVAAHSSDSFRELFVRVLGQGREMLTEILEIGRERGELRTDLDCKLHARLFQQMMLGTMTFWGINPSFDLGTLVDDAVHLYWISIESRGRDANRPGRQEGARR